MFGHDLTILLVSVSEYLFGPLGCLWIGSWQCYPPWPPSSSPCSSSPAPLSQSIFWWRRRASLKKKENLARRIVRKIRINGHHAFIITFFINNLLQNALNSYFSQSGKLWRILRGWWRENKESGSLRMSYTIALYKIHKNTDIHKYTLCITREVPKESMQQSSLHPQTFYFKHEQSRTNVIMICIMIEITGNHCAMCLLMGMVEWASSEHF